MCGVGCSFSMLHLLQMLQSAFWIILVRRLDYFNTFHPVQKPYLCTEFQSALKFQTNMAHVNC